jgi:phosphogluconate dehydratase
VAPGDGLRDELTREAVRTVLGHSSPAHEVRGVRVKCPPIGRVVDERCVVNAMVALLATGGSTNHLIHWVAVARAAGVLIDWNDFSMLSEVVPLLTHVYPNGSADINQFQSAGGPGHVIRELLDGGFMFEDVLTVRAGGIRDYTQVPSLDVSQAGSALQWRSMGPSRDTSVVRPVSQPFSVSGGLKLLQGNLGRSVIKVSAVREDRHIVQGPARVFDAQEDLLQAFNTGELERLCAQNVTAGLVCVVHWQGPRANGMPELHKLTPAVGGVAGQGLQGGTGHRWPHEWRLR